MSSLWMAMFDTQKQVVFPLVGVLFGLWLLSKIMRVVRPGSQTTPLRGPASKSLFFGLSNYIRESPDSSMLFGQWAEEYGSVFSVPTSLGSSQIILTDPKAIASFFAQGTVTYVRSPGPTRIIKEITGHSLLVMQGETHKRQRKALNPAFNSASIRRLTPVFFDCAHKVKAGWDALIDSTKSGEAVIDILSWMNRVSLDTIGIAGFSHDFGTLRGEGSAVYDAFESFFSGELSMLDIANLLLINVIPVIDRLPTTRKGLKDNLSTSLTDIAVNLLADSEKVGDQKPEDKSIIGLLLKDTAPGDRSDSFPEEVVSQMRLLLLAGYATTSIALSWTVVELASNLDVQTKLREELSQFSAVDPTWDQLTNSLPYLDAFTHEILRLHPSANDTVRVATKDNVLPLSTPIRTRDGDLVDSLVIAEGTTVTVSAGGINRSEAFWGPDARKLKPERWLTGDGLVGAKDIQGYRHLLTFSDGPTSCLGKGFLLGEFKAVVCTIVKNFHLELKEGATLIPAKGLSRRPCFAGEDPDKVLVRVRRAD